MSLTVIEDTASFLLKSISDEPTVFQVLSRLNCHSIARLLFDPLYMSGRSFHLHTNLTLL